MMTEMTERERAILMISVDASRKAMADVARELLAEQRNQESAQKLLTQEEAAKFLSVSKKTLIEWERERIVNPIRKGRRVYYTYADLMSRNQSRNPWSKSGRK